MTEGEFAIAISVLSAAFTGGTLLYTRRLAKNDSARMKRKPLICEIMHQPQSDRDGWKLFWVTIRNLEPVSAELHAVTSRNRKGRITSIEESNDNDKWQTTATQTIKARFRLAPVGSTAKFQNPVIGFPILAQNIRDAKDLKLEWSWSDGEPI